MSIFKYNPLILLSVIATVLITGCSTVTLPKSKDLLAAELFYEKTSNNLKASLNAQTEFATAGDTLRAAAYAETVEAMNALAYIANNQINKAIQVAKIEAAKKRIREIRTLKLNLRNKFHHKAKD